MNPKVQLVLMIFTVICLMIAIYQCGYSAGSTKSHKQWKSIVDKSITLGNKTLTDPTVACRNPEAGPLYQALKCIHCEKKLYLDMTTIPTGDHNIAISCEDCYKHH